MHQSPPQGGYFLRITGNKSSNLPVAGLTLTPKIGKAYLAQARIRTISDHEAQKEDHQFFFLNPHTIKKKELKNYFYEWQHHFLSILLPSCSASGFLSFVVISRRDWIIWLHTRILLSSSGGRQSYLFRERLKTSSKPFPIFYRTHLHGIFWKFNQQNVENRG